MKENDSKYAIFLSSLLREQSKIYGYIFALIPNVSVVDDLMQETIMVMWEKFDTFEVGTNFYGWAKKIAYYKVVNHLSRSFNTETHFSQAVLESIERGADVIEKSDNRSIALETCIQKLNKNDKELIKLKYMDGMTTKEVALKNKRSVAGMYKVMARIHHLLERCIEQKLAAEEK